MPAGGNQLVRGYELHEQIGQGGYGLVYRAHQPIVSRDVAVKIILPQYANHPDFIRRFEAEAQFVARLEHLHIVPLYDYWREPGGAYLVMRWLRGGSLSACIANGSVPLKTLVRLIDQIGSALAAAHQRGVVHRDIKPANILLDDDSNFFLTDFGIAKDLEQVTTLSESDPMKVMGSPAYMAPEQIKAEAITPQTDIYSLGIVLYELLTGELPFRATTPIEMMFKHVNEPLPPLQEQRADLPVGLDAILQRATAKNPAERYPDVPSLVDDVHRVVMPASATTPGWGPTEPDAALAVGAAASMPSSSRQRDTLVFDMGYPLANPYKGLRAFQEADGPDFFGREALTRHLLARLAEAGDEARFLAVVGPSGSGKSSVVRAGLVPALRQGALPGAEHWFVVEMQPGAQPLHELERTLLRVAVSPPDRLLEWLQQDVQSLRHAIPRILPVGNAELVLVIDQFEELFTLVEDEAIRAHMLDILFAAVTDPLSRLRVIITLRADFYDRPLLHPNFGTLIRERTEVVLPLATTELARAIVDPTERAGVRLERGLEAVIMADVNEQPGALPLLQYALTELFERRTGRLLTFAAYQALGGVNGALARRAEELYDELDLEGQLATRQVFLRLVTLGEGVEDTRRRAQLSEIGDWRSESEVPNPASNGQSPIATVLDLYGRHRLLTFDRDPVTREPTVEVAHEALIREWPRLRQWLDASRANMRVQRQLQAATAEWARAGGDASFLASGARLTQFAALAESGDLVLNQAELHYLQASVANRNMQVAMEHERQTRELDLARQSEMAQRSAATRLRALVGVLVIFLLVAAGLSAFAFNKQSQAVNNAVTATVAQGQALNNAATSVANAATATVAQGQALNSAATSVANLNRSEVLRLAAEANNLTQAGGNATLTALLSIRSMNSKYSPQGDAALADAETLDFPRQLFTVRTDTGDTDVVVSLAYAPDGRSALFGMEDGTTRLWDLQVGKQLRIFFGHSGKVNAVAYAPDGRSVLTGSTDQTARLWDPQSGKVRLLFKGHTGSVDAVAYAPDGRSVLTGSTDQTARLWDIQTAQERTRFSVDMGTVSSVAFAPDGKAVLLGSENGKAGLWDPQTGQELVSFCCHTSAVLSVAFAPDGKSVLTGSADRTARLWDPQTGKELLRFSRHVGAVSSVAFAPDGKSVLTGSADRTVRLWDPQTGQELRAFTDHTRQISSLAYAPDGQYILTTDGTARLWDVKAHSGLPQFIGHTGRVTHIVYSPDGHSILTGSGDGTVRLWDPKTGRELRRLAVDVNGSGLLPVVSAGYTPDGAVFAFNERVFLRWTVESGDTQETEALEQLVAASPDGNYLFGLESATSWAIWDNKTGDELGFPVKLGRISSVAFSPNGKYLLLGSEDGRAGLWDLQTQQEVLQFSGHTGEVLSVAFSSDGKYVLTASTDQTARMWDSQSGKELRRFSGHTGEVLSVAFSSDGKYVLTASTDQTARLWDTKSGTELRRFVGHIGAVSSAAFSPDDRYVLTGSDDGTIRLWYTDYHDVIRSICARLPRDFTDDERLQYGIADNQPTCLPPGGQAAPTGTPLPAH